MNNSCWLNQIDGLPESWALTAVTKNKRPYHPDTEKGEGWKKPLPRERFKDLDSRLAAVGLILGPISGGVVAIDHDGESATAKIEELAGCPVSDALPQTVKFSSGKPGRYQVIYRVPEEFWSAIAPRRIAAGISGEQVELRWAGQQSVILGEHPETDGYRWLYGCCPAEVEVAECPMWVIENMLDDTPEHVSQPRQEWRLDKVLEQPIPLIKLLTREHADLVLSGAPDGQRNDSGAALARDLIGCENWAIACGVYFEGRAEMLFYQFANLSGLKDREANTIWRSALKSSPTPSRSDEGLQKTVAWWDGQFKSKLEPVALPAENLPAGISADSRALPFLWVEEFLAKRFEGRRWLVAGHLPLGSVVTICGNGGEGKTSLVLNWVKHICLGNPWNGFRTRKAKVLLIQDDEPEIDAREKLDIIGFGVLPPESLAVVFKWSFKEVEALEETIKSQGIELVIVDSFGSVNTGLDRDKPEFADNLDKLNDLASRYTCTFLVIDHTNKSGGQLGTSMSRNKVSELMFFRAPTEEEKRQHELRDHHRLLIFDKSRSGLQKQKILLEQNLLDYSFAHCGPLAKGSEVSYLPQRIATFLESKHGKKFTPSQMVRELGEETTGKVAICLEQLRRSGVIDSDFVYDKHGEKFRVYYLQQVEHVLEDF